MAHGLLVVSRAAGAPGSSPASRGSRSSLIDASPSAGAGSIAAVPTGAEGRLPTEGWTLATPDRVNLASWLEGLTESHPYEILINDRIYEEVKDRFACGLLGEECVKGKARPSAPTASPTRSDDTQATTCAPAGGRPGRPGV